MNILLTLAVGMAGGYVGRRARIPAGSLLGALAATLAFSLLTGRAESLSVYKIIAQIIAGVLIGGQLSTCDPKALLKLWKPTAFTVVGMLSINVLCGFTLRAISSIDLLTALLATTPGGISEMSVISSDLGANALYVSLFQFLRILFSLALFPLIARRLIVRINARNGVETVVTHHAVKARAADQPPAALLFTLAGAAAAGVVGHLSGFPAGVLILSMLAAALLGRFYRRVALPDPFKHTAQALSGTFIACSASVSDLSGLPALLPAILIMFSLYILLYFGLGLMIHRACKLEANVAFFACIPAGVSDMALISSDYGANGSTVALLQMMRLLSVVTVVPSGASQLSAWLG